MPPSSEVVYKTSHYFDAEREGTSPCFYKACLIGKTKAQMSKRDIRYCLECQVFIEADYKLYGRTYTPMGGTPQSNLRLISNAIISNSSPENTKYKELVVKQEKMNLSTLNIPSSQVDIFRPRGRPKTYKTRQLPDDKIKQMHKEGMGSKAIATQLRTEQGIDVSYKTIQRVLSGERKCILASHQATCDKNS